MLLSNFRLPESKLIEIKLFNTPCLFTRDGRNSIKIIRQNRATTSAILVANPSTKEIFSLAILVLLGVIKCKVFVFDLILKCPTTFLDKVIAKAKGLLINRLDFLLAIHKDITGYSQMYGIKPDKFLYVPFKSNNFEIKDEYPIVDNGYAVALGASQRDYATYIEASRGLSIPTVILCSDENAAKHNAFIGNSDNYPKNLRRIRESVSRDEWYTWIAESSFVVVPISQQSIQPAGISVYLEAMILKKAVIVTEGPSTNMILENEHNALLVKPADSNELRQAMQRLIEDGALRNKLAMNGYTYAYNLYGHERMRADILKQIGYKIGLIE